MIRARFYRKASGSAPELTLSLFVFFFFALFPLVNLTFLGLNMGIMALFAQYTASQAASQLEYSMALDSVRASSERLVNSGLANFAKLTAAGGYMGRGADLYIVRTNYASGKVEVYGPNIPLSVPLESSKFVYEFMAQATYVYHPVFQIFVPGLKDIPGVGSPFKLRFTCCRAVEHVDGLGEETDEELSGNDTTINFNATPGLDDPGALTNAADSGWNYPNLYAVIRGRGQEIVSENVLRVKANEDWVNTMLTFSAGQNIWIDSRADGRWGGGIASFNANGGAEADGDHGAPDGPYGLNSGQTNTGIGRVFNDPNSIWTSLIGHVGANPPNPPEGQPGFVKSQQPGLFSTNKTLLDYKPITSGPIFLKINDTDLADNQGEMIVRIVVTR